MTFFADLEPLRAKPIPDLAPAHELRRNYRDHRLDTSRPLSGEALVDIRELGIEGENFYHRHDNPPYYQRIPGSIAGLFLRRSVAARLQLVDRRLRAQGCKLFVHDAWRPIEIQAYFHDVWMPARLREKHPSLSPAELVVETEKYWAAPSQSDTRPAPHSTGGAVDLTIHKRASGEPLHMGSIFDDATALAHTDRFERQALDSYSDIEARNNRRLLYWVMTEAGFVNNPNEWWHFSWGDQMWARLTQTDAAIFGVAPARSS
jgi:zinc D-Ala-D-Ala dipeptidase